MNKLRNKTYPHPYEIKGVHGEEKYVRNYVVASGLERTLNNMTPEKRLEYE